MRGSPDIAVHLLRKSAQGRMLAVAGGQAFTQIPRRAAGCTDGGFTISIKRSRSRRPVVVAAAAVAVVAAGGTTIAVAAPPAAEPALRLVTASSTVTLDRWVGEPGEPGSVNLDLGAHIVAGKTPFEMRVTRKSYTTPLIAQQVIRQGRTTRTKSIPPGLVKDFSGLPRFLHVTLTDAAGRKVLDRNQSFCPNGETSRIRPDAPDKSPYPDGCGANPFTL